jgi:hypothetical protein
VFRFELEAEEERNVADNREWVVNRSRMNHECANPRQA